MPNDDQQDERMQKLLRELQEALFVTNAIQAPHAELLKDLEHLVDAQNKTVLAHEERLLAHEEALLAHDKMLRALSAAQTTLLDEAQKEAEFRTRTEQNLLEITEKLNGLIGYLEGQHKPPQ